MTPYEKISQFLYTSPAIKRLGIKEYGRSSERLSGNSCVRIDYR